MDDHGVLSLVKKVVHSLVVSSPGRMTIEKLMRDYRSEEGCTLPHHKLGFNDAESFLRSIPDTVKVIGHGPVASVTAVTTAKSAHIQQLVQCQRKPSNRSRNRPNHKPKYCYASERSNLIFINESIRKTNARKMQNRTYQRPKDLNIPVSYPNYTRLMYPVHTPVVYNNINAMICAAQQQNTPNPQPKYSSNPQQQTLPKIIPKLKEVKLTNPEPLEVQGQAKKSFQPQDILRPTPELKQASLTQKLEKETKEMKEAFENLSVDVDSSGYHDYEEYEIFESDEEQFAKDPFGSRERVHAPQTAVVIGDSSEKDVAVALELEPVTQPQPDLLSKPTIQEDIAKPLELQEPFLNYESSDDGDEENAVPGYAVDDRVLGVDYPKDSVRCDFKLPVRDITDVVQLEQRMEVQLVKVDNPHSFTFWVYNEEFNDYRALSCNMQMFYEGLDSDKYTMPLCLITTGHLCVVRSNISSVWERAQVLGHRPNNIKKTIEVELIDTGVIMCVSHKEVKFLMKEFAILPAQCLVGRLAFITQWKSPAWCAEAVNFFYRMVSYRRLYAKVEAINNNTAYLVLVDPDSKAPNINLNKSLIDSGLVRRCISA
ncbi:uncharacterized protein LOC108045066 isoform X2 [Drosophila rhopaloa]|uniref:Uncharacterized protein LOC108045066 isoform X2 n=1 Tax=Drosophila rhopaloa TaxID=1041015 RepID=A0A6P4EXB0_DRORH|nr:uncharacterized protein LOC108045066 isoform X2 [Drosophila rhopaloa]